MSREGHGLTERETEILDLEADGVDNDCIARRLDVSPGYVRNVLAKYRYSAATDLRINAAIVRASNELAARCAASGGRFR
ncbi:LuxR C-terminal-related transcriptional regulator [Stakelama pacifica]|uniref:Regulatory LuxR family protein n=1 Tax=Stakelama pacifica TaxID=517720 RepID=A0A4R6FNJ8_9SPHN|nr:LuxR C-terminal-related transcriptional regulator [Stakelama pacifica]TDN83017.1 regulatory LuxR family protein [Stakelama pacifica]GGO94921.1 hypothetical protein GCM10011329_17890 [Stakelama pacifica]